MAFQPSEMFSNYGRYIDDILSFFNGDKSKCEWAFSEFNKLYAGELILTWEWSDSKLVFLNSELIINREKNIIETKYYIKPNNQEVVLNY